MRKFLAMALLCSQSLFAGTVNVIVSVDWEGEDLTARNLRAFKEFRQDYPEIPIMHFLNAAYFTKKDANARSVRNKINSVLRTGDEQGLHIHSWKSLFESAGVRYKSTPSWDGDEPQTHCSYDCGHSVPMSSYSYNELRKVISFSVSTLQKQGFAKPQSFRAGGWMAAPHVLEALVDEGFRYDNSAVPVHYLDVSNAKYIQTWVANLWSHIEDQSQPYKIPLKSSSIVEIPDNGCLADYVTAEQILEGFVKIAELWKTNKKATVYYSTGFHQETAADYLPHFREGMDLIKKYAQENGIALQFQKYPLKI